MKQRSSFEIHIFTDLVEPRKICYTRLKFVQRFSPVQPRIDFSLSEEVSNAGSLGTAKPRTGPQFPYLGESPTQCKLLVAEDWVVFGNTSPRGVAAPFEALTERFQEKPHVASERDHSLKSEEGSVNGVSRERLRCWVVCKCSAF